MQRYFKDLPEALVDVHPDAFQPTSSLPILTSLSDSDSYNFLKQGMFCSASDLNIQIAKLTCDVLRLKEELLSRQASLDDEKNTVNTLKNTLQLESKNHQMFREESENLKQEQSTYLAQCQLDLGNIEEKYANICRQEQDTKEKYDKLLADGEVSQAEWRRKSDEFSSTIREKDIENETIRKQLSEALSEKGIVEESFRLFKSKILTDLDKEEVTPGDHNLMTKIRVLQENNAQLSAEVKNLTRKCMDCEIEVAATKEELVLSDRMKSRLSSNVDNQCEQIDVLENKVLCANKMMLQEQTAREELKETARSLELQLIQAKFSNERSENTILDLKESKATLEKSLVDQVAENKRWMDRLKDMEKSVRTDQDKVKREHTQVFEREIQFEKQRVEQKESECAEARASLQKASQSLSAVHEENKLLRLNISSLESQLQQFSDVEGLVADLQKDLELKEDEIATLCEAFEKRGDTMKELEKRISLQASEISFLRPERDSNAKIAKGFQDQLKALENEKAELLRVSSQNDTRGSVIDDLKMTVMEYEQKLKDISDDKSNLHNSKKELDALKTDYRVLKNDYEEAEETMVELSRAAAEEIQKREKQIRTLQMLVDEKQEEGVSMQQEIKALKKSKAKLEQDIAKAESAAASSIFGFRSDK